MRLSELNPRGVADHDILVGSSVVHDEDRRGMGVSFDCPCCVGTPRSTRLAVFFSNPMDGKPHTDDVNPELLWRRSGETYETLTLSPSIDASPSGHWHGFITDGEIR